MSFEISFKVHIEQQDFVHEVDDTIYNEVVQSVAAWLQANAQLSALSWTLNKQGVQTGRFPFPR